MNKQGYVSLGVALCAALGVHALVLFYTTPSSHRLANIKPMQINLLPQPVPIQEQSVKKSVQTQRKSSVKTSKAAKKKPAKPLENSIAQTTRLPMPPASMPKLGKNEAIQTLPQVISKPIQQSILAAIVYPRQAQRRGWEGSAKFSLDIRQEMIRKVTLLVSTGYKSLDNAAQRGIASIDSLPLSDGKHILPVTFHLQ